MNKKMIALAVLLLAVLLLVIGFVSADTAKSGPLFSHGFYGYVTVGSANAVVGSSISSTIGGYSSGSFTITTVGQYGGGPSADDYANVTKYLVSCPSDIGSDCPGRAITFSITTSQCSNPGTLTHNFAEGNLSRYDLSFTCPSAAAGSAATGGATGGGGGGGGGGATEEIPVTDAATITQLQQSLPSDWVNVDVNQLGSAITTPMVSSTSEINEALKTATEAEAISALQLLKADIESEKLTTLPISVVLAKYKINNKDTGFIIYRTMFIITVSAPDYMKNIMLIDVVPKNIIMDAKDITFIDKKPTILQSDPVLLWNIAYMEKGQTMQLRYVVPSIQSRVFQKTFAAGEVTAPPAVEEKLPPPPPVEEKLPEIPPAKPLPWIGIIIIVAIVVIGLVVYWRVSKKK